MEEIQSYTDNCRSSSSSASSPSSKAPSGAFFYLRRPGSLRKSISFEDSPEWDDVEIGPHTEGRENSIHAASTSTSQPLTKINSWSFTSPSKLDAFSTIAEIRIAGASIVWKDLCVTIKGKRKYSHKVIKSSNGYALPGTLTVIMGPARSGKSTLLRAIAGRLCAPARLYGEVFVNGKKSPMPYGSYGYADRKDMLIESLTVREFLFYSVLLQFPGSLYQKKSLVEDAILVMSLADCADKLIGGHYFMKHIPCGERRRVSIARELVMRPHILFIDEPLYHLDSVSALLLMVTLKKLASTGCTLIFTMCQSSTEVFGLFDRICLLSNGNTLFFGEILACLQHFSNAGFPCPIMQSPSDHFLRAINTDFDKIIAICKNFQDDNGDFSSVSMDTAVAIRTLEATYKSSADSAAVESMILRLTEKEGPLLKSRRRRGNVVQIFVLTWRFLLIMSRDWNYFWIRLLLHILLVLAIGTLFSNAGHTLSSVKVRVSAIFVFVSFMSLLSIAGLPAHIKELKIFEHEQSNKHYGAMAFLIGHFFASIPFIFLISISSTIVFYFLCGLQNEFGLLIYFLLNIFMYLLANEGQIMTIASIWFDLFSSLLTLVFLNVLMMLVAGFFRIRNDLPDSIWKYPFSYIAFHTYSVQGLLENEYIGTSFELGEVRAISGFQAVAGSYEISASRFAKWKNLLVLFVIAIAYRIIVFLLLRFRLRAVIICQAITCRLLTFLMNSK